MSLFRRRKKNWEAEPEKQIAVMDQEEKLQEEVTALGEDEKERAIDHVLREVDTKVHEAATQSIQEVKMLEQGRCPDCGSRLEQFLYTSICTACGYSKRLSPKTGKVVVHLNDGGRIECDKIFEIRNNVHLCVRNDVVIARMQESAVSYVEYLWTGEELENIREHRDQEIMRPCSWCGRTIIPNGDEATEAYMAVGIYQDRFVFCCDKCYAAFRKQYPARVHRDCYERECSECDECVKRYDSSGRRL